MAVQLLGTRNAYEGLSTDLKPTDASVPIGSEFNELDTGHVAVWNGSGWARRTSVASVADAVGTTNALLTAVLRELIGLRQLSELANEIEIEDLEVEVPLTS